MHFHAPSPLTRLAFIFGLALFPSIPTAAQAAPASVQAIRTKRTARVHERQPHEKRSRACVRAPVEVVAGDDSATFSLTRCDGRPAPQAIENLSILARPASVPKPRQRLADPVSEGRAGEIAPGVQRLDPRLVERLEAIVERFRKPTETARVVLTSGYRPRGEGNYHSRGRALDLRMEGVDNRALIAFCKTLPDTGCGYYPNDTVVHVDVRDPGTGNVAWTNSGRTGDPVSVETPRPITTTPPDGEPDRDADRQNQSLPDLPAKPRRHGGEKTGLSDRDENDHWL
jgi:Bacterial protein of unknown function (DUF882)